jgi:DNA-directed RNA polymerase specialized sigma24 family protein
MRRESYAEAFENGFRVTRRFLLSCGAPVEDAEEIAQAAWVRGWQYRDQLRDPRLVGYWVNSIAKNLFRARFRAPAAVALDSVNPSYNMDLDVLEVKRLLDHCSARDRALLERSLEGYSAEEIARTAGITPTGIRVRLLRLRHSLRDRMATAAAS